MRRGINVYDEARQFFNRADESERLQNFSGSGKPPCIFLSHRSSDKAAVILIGEYITNAGINIYMDINDTDLQAAVAGNDHVAITLFIERGINSSTDLMAFVSKETFHSYWVPYEIGFGKRAGKNLCSLRLNDTPKLPSYLNIVRRIDGIRDLKKYLKDVKKREHESHLFSGTRGYLALLTEEVETDDALENFSRSYSLRNYLDA